MVLYLRNLCLMLVIEVVPRICLVLTFTFFRPVDNFKLIFVYVVKCGAKFFFPPTCGNVPFAGKAHLSPLHCLCTIVRTSVYMFVGLSLDCLSVSLICSFFLLFLF